MDWDLALNSCQTPLKAEHSFLKNRGLACASELMSLARATTFPLYLLPAETAPGKLGLLQGPGCDSAL